MADSCGTSDLGLRDEFEEDEEGVVEWRTEWKTERRIELIEIPDGLARRFITLAHNRPVFFSLPFPSLPFPLGFAATASAVADRRVVARTLPL